MDKTDKFVVYHKNEILRFEQRIEELNREIEELKQVREKCRQLEFENDVLKNQLTTSKSAQDNGQQSSLRTPVKPCNGSDQTITFDFIVSQEAKSDSLLKNFQCSSSLSDGQMAKNKLENPSHFMNSQPSFCGKQIEFHFDELLELKKEKFQHTNIILFSPCW